VYLGAVACHAHLGQLDEAKITIERLRAPTPVVLPNADHWRDPEQREFYLSGLRLAMSEPERGGRASRFRAVLETSVPGPSLPNRSTSRQGFCCACGCAWPADPAREPRARRLATNQGHTGIDRALTPDPSFLVGDGLSLADICFAAELCLFSGEHLHRATLRQRGLTPILADDWPVHFPRAAAHFRRLVEHPAFAPDMRPLPAEACGTGRLSAAC
jgi:hypothetical protein